MEDAVNGIELIDKFAKLKPDIAIVDINMPGLNGLEAIKALKQKGLSAKIIIHTAYSNFEYAREALTLGADEYILKPVKREKIIATISNCISKIQSEREKESEHSRLEKIINEISPIIETDFMTSILLGDINEDNFLIYMDILRMKFVSGYIMTISIPEEEISFKNMDDVEKNALKKEILSLIKSELKNICNCIISPIISNKISMFVSVEDEMSQYRFKVWSIELAELVSNRIEKAYGLTIHAGIGQLYNTLEQLSKSYKESIRALIDKSVNGNLKHFGDLFNDEANSIGSLTKFEKDLEKQIVNSNLDGCIEVINKIFSEMKKINEVEVIKDLLLGFITLIQKALSENNIFTGLEAFSIKTAFKEVIKLNSKSELQVWLEDSVKALLNEIGKERKAKVNNFVEKGVNFINDSYFNDISLEMVSEEIGISPYYFSRLFKQELNINFIDYLTEVRIKHALKFLKERDYSIKEISEKVGYFNPTYFCKVFKKYTGKTIGEFKESI